MLIISRRIWLVGAGALLLLLAVGAAVVPAALAGTPATVTVRVEGLNETLLLPTQVTTTTEPVVKDGKPEDSCTGTSAAGALQLATGGNWNGAWFSGLDYSVETIEGQSYPFTQPYYWSFWVNDKPAKEGICETELNSGESVLFFPECFSETSGVCPPSPPNPLGIEAPATAEEGKPITVTVTSYANATGVPSPAVGATVAYGGTSAVTDASGHATLSFSSAGNVILRASAPASVRTETTICVHAGNDGNCGTQAQSTPGATASTMSTTPAAPYTGPYALVPKLTSLIEGHTYKRGDAPRVLSGTVLGHTTISSISLVLRREYRGRCYAFDGVTTRFVRTRCGTGSPFKVSSNGQFSYLLPSELAPGRYVLDIDATDAAGNRTVLARGTSRIVFYVR
jgi:hypothetical protein